MPYLWFLLMFLGNSKYSSMARTIQYGEFIHLDTTTNGLTNIYMIQCSKADLIPTEKHKKHLYRLKVQGIHETKQRELIRDLDHTTRFNMLMASLPGTCKKLITQYQRYMYTTYTESIPLVFKFIYETDRTVIFVVFI